jgi:N-methylhydantoinase B
MDPRLGETFMFIDVLRGGGGALPFDDGADCLVFHGDGDAPDIPVEVAETRYPVRIEHYSLHTERYGIGKYRGGLGIIRRYRLLTNYVSMQHSGERTVCPPVGLFGGHDAGGGQVWVALTRRRGR